MKVDSDHSVIEISLMFIFAYSSYLIPESINASGIMSLFSFIIILENYGMRSMNKKTRNVIKKLNQGSGVYSVHSQFHGRGLCFYLPWNIWL